MRTVYPYRVSEWVGFRRMVWISLIIVTFYKERRKREGGKQKGIKLLLIASEAIEILYFSGILKLVTGMLVEKYVLLKENMRILGILFDEQKSIFLKNQKHHKV